MSEVNADLVSGHFKKDGLVQPSLDFWIELDIECLENTVGVELGNNGQPKIACKIPVYVPCEQFGVKHYCGILDLSKKRKK